MFHVTPQVAQPQAQQTPQQSPAQGTLIPQPMYQPVQYQQPMPHHTVYQPMQQEPMYQQVPMQPAQYPTMQTTPAAPTVQASADSATQAQLYLESAGLTRSQVEQELKAFGRISEGTRQALVAKHGEGVTNLLTNSIQTMYQSAQTAQTNVVTERHNYVAEAFKDMTQQTGEQTFAELTSWWQGVDEKGQPRMDANTKREMNKMLGAGGLQAKMALDYLINGFRAANGAQQEQQFTVSGNNNQGMGGTSTVLSASEYAQQYDAIVRKEGFNSPKLRSLDAQRQRSIAMGY